MNDKRMVAVFVHQQALEALGEAIKPYLSDGPAGPHLLCRDVDSNGALLNLNMEGRDKDGKPMVLDLMIPVSFVRLVIAVHGENEFGFV